MLSKCLVIMGVSGSGKSTIGSLLATELGHEFIEGDDYHPPHNVEKMRRGMALDDSDREPWLVALRQRLLQAQAQGKAVVLAASLLKSRYRELVLQDITDYRLICLINSAPELQERLSKRTHFMPASLLDSQLACLEMPETDYIFTNQGSPQEICTQIAQALII